MARTYETFTTSGTFTVPAGVTEVIVVCYGAGGVGALGTTLHGGIPGPGGGGGASSKTTLTVEPSDTITYTIGAGATYTSYIGNIPVGGYGGDTSATYEASTVCLAKGGRVTADGTSGGLGGSAASGTGDYKVSGGNGSSGNSTYGGGGGSAGSCSAIDGDLDYNEAGNNGSNPTGGTATTIYGSGSNGAGGNGGQSGHVAGYNGGNYGGGGGGTSPLGTFDDNDKPGSGGNGWIEFSYVEEEEEEGPGGGGAGAGNHIFLTFRNVAIPHGATINKAYVSLTGGPDNPGIWEGNTNETLNAIVCGHDIDSSDPPTDQSEALAAARTLSQVEWNEVTTWDTPGGVHTTPNIACVIQEIVDRGGWESGNDLTIFVEYNGGSEDALAISRKAADYSDDPGDAAELTVWWTYTEDGSGGVEVGGEAYNNSYNPNFSMSGGVVCGGLAFVDSFLGGSGGVVCGGLCELYGLSIEHPEGGVVCSGTATVFGAEDRTAEGGVVCGGEAYEHHYNPWIEVGGGVVCGGEAFNARVFQEIGSGGVVCGSTQWLYRKTLTVPDGAVAEDFEKFYLPIATALGDHGSDQVEFRTLAGVTMAHEVRQFDETTGRLWAVVKLAIDADNDNSFYLYYGEND